MSRVSTTNLLYDADGNLVKKIEANAVTVLAYDGSGILQTSTRTENGVSIQTTFVYDSGGALVTTIKRRL
jgi:YD repeat-containing protein